MISTLFFCWRLLGLIPGGAPFSQLSNGVKATHKEKRGETGNHPQKVPGLQKRAPVMSERLFFFLMAAWLNEGRCPGGRPSVSTN